MSERHDREIGDSLIDDVARQMTDAQPPVHFRARVLARIAEGHSPHVTWHAAWPLTPLAAAALVLVAIFIARRVAVPERQSPATVEQAVQVNPDTTVAASPDTTTVRLTAAAKASAVKKPETTYASSEIDALAPPRLELAPLRLEALPTNSIAVPQLDVIAPITVDPLPTDDGRAVGSDQRP